MKILLFLLTLTQTLYATETFTFRLQDDPGTLDWTYAHTNYETYALMNMMEGLVELDPGLQPVPALAKSWSVSADGLTYTFELKPDVKWTDGVGLKATDFTRAWKKLLSPSNKNEYTNFLFDVENAEAYFKGSLKDFSKVGVKAISDHALQIRLKRVVPYFITLLSFWVTFPQREDPRITLGPYRLSEWKRGKEITFERNETYHAEKPSVARVRGIVERDAAKARELLRAQKIDALLEVSNSDIVGARASGTHDHAAAENWQLKQFNYLAVTYLAFNLKSPRSKNAALRKAIAHALDRAQIPATLQGGQVPALSLIPKGLIGHDESASLPVDNKAAFDALTKAGLGSIAKRPELKLIARQGMQTEAANYVSQLLSAKLALKVVVQSIAPTDFKAKLKEGKHDLFIGHWGADYPDASSFMEILLSSSASNYTGWKNADYDKLVTTAGGSLVVLERMKLYLQAQRLAMAEDTVLVPLYYPRITALVRNNVAAFEVSPLNYLFFKRIALK